MKHEKRVISFCLCCILMIMLVPANVAHAVEPTPRIVQTTRVDIPRVLQEKTRWCWAACAEMAGKGVYSSSSRDKYDVVKYLKGTSSDPYPDVSGSLSDSVAGSEYVAYNRASFTSMYSTLSFNDITTNLQRGYPVQAAIAIHRDGKRYNGHMVVIYMTQFIDNSDGVSYELDYVDPGNAKSYHCTYSQFCDGSFNGKEYDQTVYVI